MGTELAVTLVVADVIVPFIMKKEHDFINVYYTDNANKNMVCGFLIDEPVDFPLVWSLTEKLLSIEGYTKGTLATFIMSSIELLRLK